MLIVTLSCVLSIYCVGDCYSEGNSCKLKFPMHPFRVSCPAPDGFIWQLLGQGV